MARPSRDRLPPLLALALIACGVSPEPRSRSSQLIYAQAEAAPNDAAEQPPATPAEDRDEQEPAPEPAPAPAPEPPAKPPLFVDRSQAASATACRSVAHIGDSTSTGMMSASYVRDPDQRLDAHYARIGVEQSFLELFGGRSLVEHRAKHENGVMVAKRLRDDGFTGCWVIGLGTCDAANVARDGTIAHAVRIQRMMEIVGDEPVLWIDAITLVEDGYWSGANMQIWNDELARVLARYPNARIYRWSEDMRPDWFVKDLIHYTSKGYTARAEMVAQALAAAFPDAG